ncbi:DNA polymerase III subunit alpha [Clostridium botulinum]|nr:DNA polymerase III subunit alpha [Clostridium botulinum]
MERVKYHSELHNHNTIGSLMDGMGTPKEILDRCDELNIKSYAITDHGTEYALYYFAELQEKYKTKILYGIELYEAYDHTVQDQDNKYFHLLTIAKNQSGIQALHRLTTMGEFEGKYFKPRVDLKQLKEFKDNLIIGSACLAGKINKATTYEQAKQYALEYKEIFGDNFYLELQAHTSEDQIKANKRLMKLHYDTNIPYIITSDSHYVKKEDKENHANFVNVNRKNADVTTTGEIYDDCYIHSTDEMYEIMFKSELTEDEITIGLQNTNKIADICNGTIEFHEPVLPKVKIPNQYKSEEEYFMALITKGWKDRNMDEQIKDDPLHTEQDYKQRVLHEYNVIKQMEYIAYHLIVADFMQWAVSQGIPTAPARGSAGGCLIAYLLKITNVNPLKYDLLFERYLNPERVSLPDIDSDFSSERREEVFKYLQRTYGENYVAQIINFSKYTPKVAIQDAGKMTKVPIKDVNAIKEFMQDDTIEESIQNAKNNKKLVNLLNNYPEMLSLAKAFEGKVKTTSTNACGVVISSKPIYQYCGMKKGDNGEQLLQVDKVITEKLGMVKCDILGTTVLQIIDEIMKMVDMDFYDLYAKIPLDDKETYEFFKKGLYYGVFQLGSYNMTKFFMKLQPKSIEDICLGISAYRPGSMKYIDDIINRKEGKEPIIYDHEILEPILKPTYGICVYQEQVMQVLQAMGGFSFAQADLVRRGMAKKKAQYVLGQRNNFIYGLVEFVINGVKFTTTHELAKEYLNDIEYTVIIEGAIHKGIDIKIAKKVFDDLEDFALYGFNKSHGLAYALLAYYTAYLKCHYPTYFMKAILSHAKDGMEISQYLTQCKDLGVQVIHPNINESDLGFSIYNGSILYGIGSLHNVGEPTTNQIMNKRPYTSFEDFMNKNVNNISEDEIKIDKSALISLINSGCFDGLPIEENSTTLCDRQFLLMKVFYNVTPLIQKVSTTQIPELFDNPDIDTKEFYKEKQLYDLHKKILSKKNKLNLYKDDEIITTFKNNYSNDTFEIENDELNIIKNKYTSEYNKHLKHLKQVLKDNNDQYTLLINKSRVVNAYLDYVKNNDEADLEFESTSFYFSKSWLEDSAEKYHVDEFKDIPNLNMDEVGYYKKKDLYTIVGVLTGKIKKHSEIVLLTNSGIVIAKLGDILYNSVASDLKRGDKIALSGYVGNGFFRAEFYQNNKSNKLLALKVLN